jgi:protoporphyrinogen oxidase
MYDFIIIGGGISGLYTAYQLLKNNPKIKFCILEKESRIGGRMGSENFHGIDIPIGAGIGRMKKDKLLIQIMKELKIKYTEGKNNSRDLNPHPIQVAEIIKHLRSEYRKNPSESYGKTFREYATQKLGKKTYDSFVISAGYTDYENEDVYETLYFYGMDDNEPGWGMLFIPWNDLLDALIQKIGRKNIHTNTNVVELKTKEQTKEDYFHILSNNNNSSSNETKSKIWKTTNIIIASKICVVKDLIPGANRPDSLYQQIHSQPFLRLYAKATHKSIPILNQHLSMTVTVPGPIHKIIPMSKEKGIYMIAYTDNKGVSELQNILKNTAENRKIWARKIEEIFGLDKNLIEFEDMKDYLWHCGTHYYSPFIKTKEIQNRNQFIYQAQRPMKGIWVVGEMISRNQGWVEGALESVHAIL